MEFIISKDQYLLVKAAWAGKTTHSSSDIVIYNLLRGFPSVRGFTPLQTQRKIQSRCNDPWNGYTNAANVAKGTFNFYKRPKLWSSVTNGWIETDPAIVKVECEAKFKERFGIDLTDEIRAAIDSATRINHGQN